MKTPLMENKRNEATINRPEGDRVLDASYVFADLDEYVRQLKDEDAWQKNDRNAITLFKSEATTIVLTCLHEDARISHNAIDGLLTVQLIDGKIRLETPDGTADMRSNQLISFHRRVDHSIQALDDATLLLTVVRIKDGQ